MNVRTFFRGRDLVARKLHDLALGLLTRSRCPGRSRRLGVFRMTERDQGRQP
jgi:hypothetical protein